MAHVFNGGSTFIAGSAAISLPIPHTIYCVAEHNSLATEGDVFGLCRNNAALGSNERTSFLLFRGDQPGDPIQMRGINGGAFFNAVLTAGAYTINTLHSLIGIAGTPSKAGIDGTLTSSGGGDQANPISVTLLSIGNQFVYTGAATVGPVGRIASCAYWDVELTQAEVSSLARGFPPRRIRPQSLKHYIPLLRNVQDLRQAITLTYTGTPVVGVHPRSYGI
jgi:hypothetical protein